MTVSVPSTAKGHSTLLAAEITVLAARTDYQSQQRLRQQQEALVLTLLAEGHLNASSILSTVAYTGLNPLATAIAKQTALVASYGATLPGNAATRELDQLQRQAVQELLATSQMTAANVLSTMAYIGGAQH